MKALYGLEFEEDVLGESRGIGRRKELAQFLFVIHGDFNWSVLTAEYQIYVFPALSQSQPRCISHTLFFFFFNLIFLSLLINKNAT